MMIDGHELAPGDFIGPSRALVVSVTKAVYPDNIRHVRAIDINGMLIEATFNIKAKFEVIR